MAEIIKLTCPDCGRILDIPADLVEFSCLYCGARCNTAVLLEEAKKIPAERLERLEALRPRLAAAVTGYPDYYKKLGKKDFFHAFERYENENRELFQELDFLVSTEPLGLEERIKPLCGQLVEDISAHMEKDKRWKPKKENSSVIFEYKVVMAIFLCPCIKKMGLSCAESFCTQLHKSWMKRFPKEVWTPGVYEVIEQGYKKRKWCYITTATCRMEGKPDDCPELTAFRAFRDGWLTEQGGRALIDEYYEKAPGIVTCIELCDEPAARYGEIRSAWLAPCYGALQDGRMEDCKNIYISMVRSLEERYSN